MKKVYFGGLIMELLFFFHRRRKGCTGSDVFHSFSIEENKESVLLKTTDNSFLIITVKMLRVKSYVIRVQM